MNAAEINRRAEKVDLIVIDEDDSSSAPVKEEEGLLSGGEPVSPPPPSPEVIELREKNAKLERMYQRACRAAREADIRAVKAVDQLDEANRRAETAARNELNTQPMREKNTQLSERVTTLTQQLEAAREASKEMRAVDRARIDELSAKLAEFERVSKEHEIPVRNQLDPVSVLAPPPEKIVKMEESCGVEEEVADKVAQAMLNLPPRFPVRRQQPQPSSIGPVAVPVANVLQPLKQADGSLETSKTLQCIVDGEGKRRVIRESEALEEQPEMPSTALFRRGDDGTTLGTLMNLNGEDNPFIAFPEPSFSKRETRKRPHEENSVERGQSSVQMVLETGMEQKNKGPQLSWAEFKREMRGQKRGEAGSRVLGLLLGRETPASKGDKHASFSSVQSLRKKADHFGRRTGGFELNAIMKQSKFVCICGAKIANAITMLNHFNSRKHIPKRSYPVYQSDVDYWIHTIRELNRAL